MYLNNMQMHACKYLGFEIQPTALCILHYEFKSEYSSQNNENNRSADSMHYYDVSSVDSVHRDIHRVYTILSIYHIIQ